MNIPMREKYVDEAVGVWFIFGEKDGKSDVSDQNKDIFQLLPTSIAEEVIKLQEQFRNKLYALLCGGKD